jgi:hypothetical protein
MPGGPMLRQAVRTDAAPAQPQAAQLPQFDDHEAAPAQERGPVILGPAAVAAPDQRRPVVPPQRPAAPATPAPAPSSTGGGLGRLFRQVTGGSVGMKRNLDAEPQPARSEPPATLVIHPSDTRRPAPQQGEMGGIDIPTFLRRQNNTP